MSSLSITIIILAITIGLFLSGKFPLGVCGMFCCLALLATKVLTAAQAFAGFSNTNVIIMIAMMIVSAGLMKTSLVEKIKGFVSIVGGTGERAIVVGFGLIIIVLAQFMAGFASLACMIPFINGMCDEMKVSRSKVYFPLCVISLAWVAMLPLASGMITIAMLNGPLESYGLSERFGAWTLFLTRLPSTLFLTIWAMVVMPKHAPAVPSVEVSDDLGIEIQATSLSRGKEIAAYALAIGTVLMMLTSSLHGIPIYTSAAAGAFLMVLIGVLTEKEAVKSIAWSTVFMFGGILPLGTAMEVSGAGAVLSGAIQTLIGGSASPWVLTMVFGFIAWVLTQFMSNTAVIMAFLPLVAMICANMHLQPIGIFGTIFVASTASYLTPMAAEAVSLTISAGGYSLKDLLKTGFLPSFLALLIAIVWNTLMFPAY